MSHLRKLARGSALLLVLAGLATPLHAEPLPCAPPVDIGDGWELADAAASGFDAEALCTLLDGVAQGQANLHSVVIERHGRLVAELYRRGPDRSIWSLMAHDTAFGPTVPHDLRSISKSVIGLLFGIAQADGKIGSLSTPVLDFYPEYADLRDPRHDAITLDHLLAMSSGIEWNESRASYGSFGNDETRLYWDWAPYRFVLGRPVVAAPGSRFDYNGGGTAVLADIVVRATRTPLRELARRALFEPLGITDWEWVADLHGRPLAFAGLRMRPRDLAKVGHMLLAHGQWQGREIVPAAWVAASMQPHIDTGDGLHYGYQWWVGDADWRGETVAWTAGFGNGGQRLFLVPALDLAVVMTAGAYNDAAIGRHVNRLFRQIVATLDE